MICVPSSTSTVPASMAPTMAAAALASAVVSLVITATRAFGSTSPSSSASRSTPGPEAVSRPTAPQLGQCSGVGMA